MGRMILSEVFTDTMAEETGHLPRREIEDFLPIRSVYVYALRMDDQRT